MQIDKRYIIGNKDKTTFLGWDVVGGRLLPVYHIGSADIMSKEEADNIVETNKNTHFYLRHHLNCVYPIHIVLL